jgi:hypothetical protein
MRYGINGSLFDFGKGELVPSKNLVQEILELIAEDASALNCASEVAQARTIVGCGTSADRPCVPARGLLPSAAWWEVARPTALSSLPLGSRYTP